MQTEVVIGFVLICVITFWANRLPAKNQPSEWFQLALYAIVAFTGWLGINMVLIGLASAAAAQGLAELPAELADIPPLALPTAIITALFCGVLALISLGIVASERIRLFIQRRVLQPVAPEQQYNPKSPVHTLALVLALFMVANLMANYVLVGGLAGLAEELQNTDISVLTLLSNFMIYFVIALLGVGIFVRRSISQTLERLALTLPNWQDVAWGLGGGLFLFFLQISLVMLWSVMVSPETLAEQSAATEEIFAAFSGSLLLGFMLALTASVGEEILFRGALQPIFGLFWTSLFFVLMHTQYTFTPASAIIFLVAVGFAWLRQRRNTTTAIIAHFVYNFIPFLLFWIVSLIPVSASIIN